MRWLLDERLAATGAWTSLVERLTGRAGAGDTGGWLLAGLLAGALLYALLAGGPDFHGYGWLTDTFQGTARLLIVPILLAAGVLIGFGAKTAGGLHVGERAERQCARVAREPGRHGDVLRDRDRGVVRDRGADLMPVTREAGRARRGRHGGRGGLRRGAVVDRAEQPRGPARGPALPRPLPVRVLRVRARHRLRRAAAPAPHRPARRPHRPSAHVEHRAAGASPHRRQRAVRGRLGRRRRVPGPVATQVAQGVPWALCTATGLGLGVWLYLRRQPARAPAPAGASRPGPEAPELARAPAG